MDSHEAAFERIGEFLKYRQQNEALSPEEKAKHGKEQIAKARALLLDTGDDPGLITCGSVMLAILREHIEMDIGPSTYAECLHNLSQISHIIAATKSFFLAYGKDKGYDTGNLMDDVIETAKRYLRTGSLS